MNIDFLNNLDDTGRHNLVLLRCDSNSLKDTIDQLKHFGITAVNIVSVSYGDTEKCLDTISGKGSIWAV